MLKLILKTVTTNKYVKMGQTLTHKYNTATYIPNIEKYNIQNGRVFNHANEAVAVAPIIEGEQF